MLFSCNTVRVHDKTENTEKFEIEVLSEKPKHTVEVFTLANNEKDMMPE